MGGSVAVVSAMGMMWTASEPSVRRSSGRMESLNGPAGLFRIQSLCSVMRSVKLRKLARTARLARRMEK